MLSTTAATSNVANSECCCELENDLYAEILSYIVYDTRDLAKLRFISRQWNQNVLPFVLKSVGFIRNCYNNKYGFIERLVEFGEETHTNHIFGIDSMIETSLRDFPALFKEGERTQSITFPKARDYYKNYIVSRPNSVLFPHQAKILLETRSPEEFESVSEEALTNGIFFSIQQFEAKGTTYNMEESLSDEYNCESLPVVLACKVKRVDCVIDQTNGVVVLHGRGENSRIMPLDSKGDYRGYVTTDIASEEEITCLVPLILQFDEDYLWEIKYDAASSEVLELTSLLSKNQEKLLVQEGVAIADGFVPNSLHDKLMNQINDLANNTDADYHPHSHGIVRDLVHPALYSYVNEISPQKTLPPVLPVSFPKRDDALVEKSDTLSEGLDISSEEETPVKTDYWGRTYEASSRYQWLPTYFNVDCNGTCTIEDYINNLVPRPNYEPLYDSIAQLFSHVLPLIESVFSYGKVVRPRIREGDDDDDEDIDFDDNPLPPIEEDYYSLRGEKLQVITKIVDYELRPGETYDGVWHVEGMSHEEIVATAIYFIHRDESIVGGDILFKRAFHKEEAVSIFSRVDQMRPPHLERIIDEGLLPLGRVKTLHKRLLVFPNSHVHKVSEMKNALSEDFNASDSVQKRRIVVFFLINPEKRIISTREVSPQAIECGGKMTREDAFEHRLELMKERKFHKQDWNVRNIELCEH